MDSKEIAAHVDNALGKAKEMFFAVWCKRDAMEAKIRAKQPALSPEELAKEVKHEQAQFVPALESLFMGITESVLKKNIYSLDALPELIAEEHQRHVEEIAKDDSRSVEEKERDIAETGAMIDCIAITLGVGVQANESYARLCRQSAAQSPQRG